MNALDVLRGYRSGILLSATCLLWLISGSVSAETASSDAVSSSGTELESALKEKWGVYKVQWGANQYRGKETTEETETTAESSDAVEDSRETKLTRDASRSLRSGTSDAEASDDSSLRSLEGELPEVTLDQSASEDQSVSDPSVISSTP